MAMHVIVWRHDSLVNQVVSAIFGSACPYLSWFNFMTCRFRKSIVYIVCVFGCVNVSYYAICALTGRHFRVVVTFQPLCCYLLHTNLYFASVSLAGWDTSVSISLNNLITVRFNSVYTLNNSLYHQVHFHITSCTHMCLAWASSY